MARAPWTPASLYEVAQRWVDQCLRRDDSLFTPGAAIWTRDVVEEAAEPLLFDDIRKLDFITKLRDQLDGCSDAAKQFTAELLYIHVLTISNSGVEAKRGLVEPVLSWMNDPVGLPDDLVEPFSDGVANYGAGLAQRDRFVKYFVNFAREWKRLPDHEIEVLLADPWAFRDFVHRSGPQALMQREAILHLAFPETFENAIAPGDKRAIVKAFAGLPNLDTRNDDRGLASVRAAVETAIGRPLDLYTPWFRRIWGRGEWGEWEGALRWGRMFFQSPKFDGDEREYKLTVAARMEEARRELLRDGDWLPRLRTALGAPNNLTHWQFEHGPLLRWAEGSPNEAAAFLRALWAEPDIDMLRLGDALALLPQSVLSSTAGRLALSAALLLGLDPHRYPPYRATVIQKFVRLLGEDAQAPLEFDDGTYTPVELGSFLRVDPKRVRDILREEYPRSESEHGQDWLVDQEMAQVVYQRLRRQDGDDEARHYGDFLTLLDEFRVRLLARGLEVRDLLDVQGIVWCLAQGDPYESWTPDDQKEFRAWISGGESQPAPKPKPAPGVAPTGRLKAWLVRGANVSGSNVVPEWLERGFVSVGWQELGPLDESLTDTGIFEHVRAGYPEESAGAWRAAAGNLNRFLNLMRPGDLVLTADGDRLFVGRVAGDVSFDDAGPPATARRRSVEWLNAEAPASRAQVQAEHPSLYSKLRTLLTVTDLREDAATVASLVGEVDKPEAPTLRIPAVDGTLAESLHLPERWLRESVHELLLEKKQLVFFGPPGTGKTLVAQRLAQHLVADGGEYELIQFHPSYSYEDFFEGYRPAQVDGGMGVSYELTPGPLRRIAEAAADDPAHPYVLIIDEVNRGNIPKIFGELLFLLEYRNEEIPLQYSPHVPFGLPENLFVIATMNTADRSIALVDAALRRRFYFVPFMPREDPIRSVLGEWLRRHSLDDEPARLMHELNERISTDEIAIGPSYFMTKDGQAPNLERVWRHAIMPLLEEHYYGTGRDVEAEFSLSVLRAEMSANAAPDASEPREGEESLPAPSS